MDRRVTPPKRVPQLPGISHLHVRSRSAPVHVNRPQKGHLISVSGECGADCILLHSHSLLKNVILISILHIKNTKKNDIFLIARDL